MQKDLEKILEKIEDLVKEIIELNSITNVINIIVNNQNIVTRQDKLVLVETLVQKTKRLNRKINFLEQRMLNYIDLSG